MRRFAISDIHGCYHTFQELLHTIGLNESDKLTLLGDYINRGDYSKEVVDLLVKLEIEGYNIHCLKGNHEDMVFDSFLYADWPGGAAETLKSFGIDHLKEMPQQYLRWLMKLKHYHISGDCILVHAGLNFSQAYLLQENRNMCWISHWYNNIDFKRLRDKVIIQGHTPLPKNEILEMRDNISKNQVIDIDNGCYNIDKAGFGNLCCFDLDSREIYFEKFKD